MSSLKHIDRIKLEKFFGMESGYVCDFSNRTFRDFILENTGIDVYDETYSEGGGSKANRFRTFWKKESDHLTSKLLKEMLEYWKLQKNSLQNFNSADEALYKECLKIADRLGQGSPVEDIDAFTPNSFDEDFNLLANSIRECIQKNRANEGLDRLHTFVMKYVRELCNKYFIPYEKDTSLHTLFGGYIKFLQKENILESEMTERILKTTISILEAFNTVRNNHSFAHDNPILNNSESILIFNSVSHIIRFIQSLERKISEKNIPQVQQSDEMEWDDMAFTDEQIEAAGDQWIQQQIDMERGK